MTAAITREVARAQGYAPISMAFRACEAPEMRSLIAGLRGKQYRIVSVPHGLEIWRLKAELNRFGQGDELKSGPRV